MKMEKRFLSLIIAAVMVFSCIGIGFGRVKADAVQALQYGSIGWQIHTKNNATINTYGTDREVTIQINYSDGTAQNNTIVNPGGGGSGTYADWFESNTTNSGTISNVIISKSISSFAIILGPGGPDSTWPSDDNWTFDSAYIYFTPAGGTQQTVSSDTGTHELADVGNSYTMPAPSWFANHNHTLTFNANTGVGSTSLEYVYGASLTAPTVTKTGYTLTGWSPVLPSSAPDTNTTYTAQWIANSYTLTFDPGSGTVTPTSKVVSYDSTYGAGTAGWPTPIKTGYSFNGWFTGSNGSGTKIESSTIVALSANQTLYAYWTVNTYTIKYDGNGSTAGSTPDSSYTYNITSAISTNGYSKLGHSFLGWSLSQSASTPDYLNGQNVLNLTSDPNGIVTFYAVWLVNDYQVIYNANGGTGIMPSITITFGQSAALSAVLFSKTGYTFQGWATSLANANAGIVTYSNGQTYTMNTEGATLYAVWSANSYHITFDANGGTGGSSTIMHYGDSLNPPVVTRTGYLFIGWTPSVPATVGMGDATYTATWTIFSYTITFDANGGTGGTINTLTYGTALTAPAVTRFGYTFAGWSPVVPATVPAANTTYTAQWTPKNFTITFDANGGTGGTSGPMAYGTTLTAPTVLRTGYTFTGWQPSLPATVPSANTTYTAQWSINSYTITFNANGGTGGTSGSMTFGATLSAPSVSRTGYTFNGWSPTVPATVPALNATYTAQWIAKKTTVTFDANGGIGGTSAIMDFESPLVAPNVTRTGYTFLGWFPWVPATVPMDNTTYTAQWSINNYLMTFDANGGVGGTSYYSDYGTALAAPTVTRTGYTFVGWSPSVPSTVPAADTTYTAQWNSNSFTVAFDLNGGIGTIPVSQSGIPGTAVTLPVQGNIARQYYNFLGWATSSTATTPLSSYLIPSGNVTLYAVWSRVPVTLSVKAGSTTIIDQSKGFIYGLEEGMTKADFLSSFVTVNGDGSLRITPYTDSFGTQTKVELLDNVTGLVVKTYYIVIFGDVDGDGYVTAADENILGMVASYQMSLDEGSAIEYAADLTQDQQVDTFDLNLVSAATNYSGTISQTAPWILI